MPARQACEPAHRCVRLGSGCRAVGRLIFPQHLSLGFHIATQPKGDTVKEPSQGKQCLQPRLEMSWRVDEAESWGRLLKGQMLLHLHCWAVGPGGSWHWEEGGGAGSRRELKTKLRTRFGLSYNFRNGGRKGFNGISDVVPAFSP